MSEQAGSKQQYTTSCSKSAVPSGRHRKTNSCMCKVGFRSGTMLSAASAAWIFWKCNSYKAGMHSKREVLKLRKSILRTILNPWWNEGDWVYWPKKRCSNIFHNSDCFFLLDQQDFFLFNSPPLGCPLIRLSEDMNNSKNLKNLSMVFQVSSVSRWCLY